jgi:SAM-dependent methyltransferase
MSRQEQLREEVAFWDAEISMKGQFSQYTQVRFRKETRRLDYPEWIDPFVESVRRRFPGEPVKALDVGSGPLSTLAWAHDVGLMEVQAADPLADEYNRMLREHHIDFPCPAIGVACEQLTSRFAPGSFHFVYSQNALDHAADIQKCFEQIQAVLRPGGLFVLWCHEHEGRRENYQGLHQYNFFARDGVLCCTNRAGESCLDLRKLRLKRILLDPLDSPPYAEGVNTLVRAGFEKPGTFLDRIRSALMKLRPPQPGRTTAAVGS